VLVLVGLAAVVAACGNSKPHSAAWKAGNDYANNLAQVMDIDSIRCFQPDSDRYATGKARSDWIDGCIAATTGG
jgi:hypothetical protein